MAFACIVTNSSRQNRTDHNHHRDKCRRCSKWKRHKWTYNITNHVWKAHSSAKRESPKTLDTILQVQAQLNKKGSADPRLLKQIDEAADTSKSDVHSDESESDDDNDEFEIQVSQSIYITEMHDPLIISNKCYWTNRSTQWRITRRWQLQPSS